MADELEASAKIEEAIKDVLVAETGAGDLLEGYTVLTDLPGDEAIEAVKAIVILTPNLVPQQAEEQNQTFWNQTVEIIVIDGPQEPGMISRATRIGLAKVHGVLVAIDRTLGGRLQDLQEIDIAGTQAEGKDVHDASLQYRAEFYTPRDDWFTILGQGGAQF